MNRRKGLDTFESEGVEGEPTNAEAYLDQMIRLLRNDGLRFPDNQKMKFAALDPLEDGYPSRRRELGGAMIQNEM